MYILTKDRKKLFLKIKTRPEKAFPPNLRVTFIGILLNIQITIEYCDFNVNRDMIRKIQQTARLYQFARILCFRSFPTDLSNVSNILARAIDL